MVRRSRSQKIRLFCSLRESSFNMTRGEGMKILRYFKLWVSISSFPLPLVILNDLSLRKYTRWLVKNRVFTDLNSRVFLSKNSRLIVAPRKFDVLKTNICLRSEASRKNILVLPLFSLIRDFGKRNTRGNVSKISVSLVCYSQIGSKSTNHSPIAWRREG